MGLGLDIPIPSLQLIIHPIELKEIGLMGESKFFPAVQLLCLDKDMLAQGENDLQSMSNFQVLMSVLNQSEDKTKKTSVRLLLQFLFPQYQVLLTPNSIILNKEDDSILIDDSNFDILQEVLREVLCVSSMFQGENIIYNPLNNRAKEIAAKLIKGRQKVAAIKGKKSANSSIFIRYVSILITGQIATREDCAKMNLFTLFDLMERFNLKRIEERDFNIRLAGGKPDKTVDSWEKDLYDDKQSMSSSKQSDAVQVFEAKK